MILKGALIIFLLLETNAIVNHNPSKPGCPSQVSPMQNFLAERFVGVWYPIQKYSLQFEVGKCITLNVGFSRINNKTLVTMTHAQRIGNNFTIFEQNATMHNVTNSIWGFKYNMSLNGNWNFIDFCHFDILFWLLSWRWWIHLHSWYKLREFRCCLRLRNTKQKTKWSNGLDS